jgi:hypothetical protein
VEIDAWSNAWALLGSFFNHAQGFPVQLRLEVIQMECLQRKAKSKGKRRTRLIPDGENAPRKAPSNAPSIPQAMPRPCPSSSSSSLNTSLSSEPSSNVEDITPIVAQIVVASPRSRLRNWGPDDVQYSDNVATLQAVDTEIKRGEVSRGAAHPRGATATIARRN